MNKMKLLAIGALFGCTFAGGAPVIAEDRFTDQPKSDYEVCMEYCMAPEENNTFNYCNGQAQCGQYGKKG